MTLSTGSGNKASIIQPGRIISASLLLRKKTISARTKMVTSLVTSGPDKPGNEGRYRSACRETYKSPIGQQSARHKRHDQPTVVMAQMASLDGNSQPADANGDSLG